MKMNFKFSIVLLFLALGTVVLAQTPTPASTSPLPEPASVSPSPAPITSVEPVSNVNTVFCKLVSGYLDKIDNSVKSKLEGLKSKHTEIGEKLTQKETDLKGKLKTDRDKWDTNRLDFYSKIQTNATTNAQKQALVAFKAKVETLVTARRTAIDAAVKEYQDGVKKIIADRKAKVNELAGGYESALKTAFEKAKTDCAAGSTSALKDTLKSAMKTAREKYTTDKQEIAKIGDLLKPLIDKRKTAVKKAQDDFKTGLEAAKTELKKAFGE